MQNEDIKIANEDLVLATTAASFQSGGPSNESGEAPSAKKMKPHSLYFSSEDLPPGSVSTDSSDVAA